MAITDISEPTKFNRLLMGLTADVKPTGTQYIGSVFLEEKVDNTVLVYVTKDGTNWRLIDIGDDTLAAEVAKIPKSDGAVSWNATALASILTQAAAAIAADPSLAQVLADTTALLIDTAAIIARQETVESTAQKRQAGKTQIFRKVVQQAANLGAYTLATITSQSCLIKSITVKAVTAAQADLTSAAVTGGAGGIIPFLSAVDTAKALIDAVDEQVWWSEGAVELAATKTIVMTLVGTGATAVDLLVTIGYESCVDGGYLA